MISFHLAEESTEKEFQQDDNYVEEYQWNWKEKMLNSSSNFEQEMMTRLHTSHDCPNWSDKVQDLRLHAGAGFLHPKSLNRGLVPAPSHCGSKIKRSAKTWLVNLFTTMALNHSLLLNTFRKWEDSERNDCRFETSVLIATGLKTTGLKDEVVIPQTRTRSNRCLLLARKRSSWSTQMALTINSAASSRVHKPNAIFVIKNKENGPKARHRIRSRSADDKTDDGADKVLLLLHFVNRWRISSCTEPNLTYRNVVRPGFVRSGWGFAGLLGNDNNSI